MTRRPLHAFIATLLAVAVSVAGAAVAIAEDPPPDEQVNLRCIAESLLGVPVDDHPDNDTLCFRLARNQNCTGTGESRVCDDETPWPEHVFNAPWQRTNGERTQIRVAYIVARSLSTGCDHYTTSDAPTSGAHRLICLSQTVSRARVIACQSAVTALGYRRVHDLYVDGGTFDCPSAPRGSSTQSQQQSEDTARVVVAEVDELETAQQQSDDQQSEDTAQVVVAEVDELETAQQQSDDQQSEDTAQVVVAEVDELETAQQQSDDQQSEDTAQVVVAEVDELETAQQQSDDQQPRTRLAWIASEVARKTGQSCSVIDGRVTCAP